MLPGIVFFASSVDWGLSGLPLHKVLGTLLMTNLRSGCARMLQQPVSNIQIPLQQKQKAYGEKVCRSRKGKKQKTKKNAADKIPAGVNIQHCGTGSRQG